MRDDETRDWVHDRLEGAGVPAGRFDALIADSMTARTGAEAHKRRNFESDFDEMIRGEQEAAFDERLADVVRAVARIDWGDGGPPANPYGGWD